MISMKNVTKTFSDKKAVDNLSIELRVGEIFGFLGPNGAGKSTTLKMICGVLQPDEGEITINGYNILTDPLMAKQQFAYVPDSPDTLLRLQGKEFLKFMADMYQVPADLREKRVKQLTEEFEIADVLNNKIQSYSHGMRQKLMVTAALLHNPPVWILDEPMTGLDPASAFLLKEKMHEHAGQAKTVLFSTHILEVAEKICDRIGIIDKGKLIFVGTVAEMRQSFAEDASLETMFLQLTNKENQSVFGDRLS